MPFTIFDSRVDRISINPRKQAYEKVSSKGVSFGFALVTC